jgi:protein-ribulosamine 3-kinase
MPITSDHEWPANGLLSDPPRIPIEQRVSAHLGRTWRVTASRDLVDFASHPAFILADNTYSVFVKFSDAVNGLEQFQIEQAGLQLLSERAGVLTPVLIDSVAVDDGALMILEGLQAVERTPQHWRQVGQTLARIHSVKGTQFGLETHNFFGPLYQDNSPTQDWVTFFAERRMRPLLKMAVESGHMPPNVTQQIETLIARLPKLCGPTITPTLLHGDAQQNNFISTDAGTYVIDPAVYYGHPEVDLALVDYFAPVPEEFFSAYREIMPIDPGFAERRELWRIPGYLAHVIVAGPAHLGKLVAAVQLQLR